MTFEHPDYGTLPINKDWEEEPDEDILNADKTEQQSFNDGVEN